MEFIFLDKTKQLIKSAGHYRALKSDYEGWIFAAILTVFAEIWHCMKNAPIKNAVSLAMSLYY